MWCSADDKTKKDRGKWIQTFRQANIRAMSNKYVTTTSRSE